jgi:hypothetical protein
MIGLGEIGRSIGEFQYLCNNLEYIIGELMKHLGNDLGDIYEYIWGFLLVGELLA